MAAGAAAVAAGWRHTTDFSVDHLSIDCLEPGALHGKDAFRILHISDLHMFGRQDTKTSWLGSLVALEPDLVVNTGDNLGDRQAVPRVLNALNGLLTLPGLFVFGNNDYFGPRPVNPLRYLAGKKQPVSGDELPWRSLRAGFIERGWLDATHTRQEFTVGDVRIAAAGVDDPHLGKDNYGLIAGHPNPDADISLGLTHSPEPHVLDRFAADGYTITVAGHTHGGQICLPTGTPIVTNCGINRAAARGLSRYKGMWLNVSNGIGTSKYAPIRLFCAPSATLLTLTEKQA